MKAIVESPEVFQAYAMIDYHYFLLKQIAQESSKPLHPLAVAVDRATGHDPTLKFAERAKDCLQEIIRNKKIVEADFSEDEQQLEKLFKIFPSLKNKESNE